MALLDAIRPAIARKLSEFGLELYDLKCIRAGRRPILRVLIDRDGGATISDCEKASRDLSVLLDVEGYSNMPYCLEVSSPGIDRKLTTEKDFQRLIGRRVRIKLGISEGREPYAVDGTVVSCANGTLTLETTEGARPFQLADIESGNVLVTFS